MVTSTLIAHKWEDPESTLEIIKHETAIIYSKCAMSSNTKLGAERIHIDLKQGLITLQEGLLVVVTELLLLHKTIPQNRKNNNNNNAKTV